MFKDIQNVAKTRKFWVGMGGAVLSAIATYVFSYEEFAPILAVVTALGVYQVPNAKK